jgi:hypothetical protein
MKISLVERKRGLRRVWIIEPAVQDINNVDFAWLQAMSRRTPSVIVTEARILEAAFLARE